MRKTMRKISDRLIKMGGRVFEPARGPELIICVVSLWWLIAALLYESSAITRSPMNPFLPIYVAMEEPPIMGAAVTIVVMFWLNFFRLVDRIREITLLVAVACWSMIAYTFMVKFPTAPTSGAYVAIAWLSIFTYVRNTCNGSTN